MHKKTQLSPQSKQKRLVKKSLYVIMNLTYNKTFYENIRY